MQKYDHFVGVGCVAKYEKWRRRICVIQQNPTNFIGKYERFRRNCTWTELCMGLEARFLYETYLNYLSFYRSYPSTFIKYVNTLVIYFHSYLQPFWKCRRKSELIFVGLQEDDAMTLYSGINRSGQRRERSFIRRRCTRVVNKQTNNYQASIISFSIFLSIIQWGLKKACTFLFLYINE